MVAGGWQGKGVICLHDCELIVYCDLASFDSRLDVIVLVESSTSKSISLQILHHQGAKSTADIATGELYVNFPKGCHLCFIVC
jgi:hypothetical protein